MAFQIRDLLALALSAAIFFGCSRLLAFEDLSWANWLNAHGCVALWALTLPLAGLAFADARTARENLYAPGKLMVLLQVGTLVLLLVTQNYWLWMPQISDEFRVRNMAYSVLVKPIVPAAVAVSVFITLKVTRTPPPPQRDWPSLAGLVLAVCWVIMALAESLLFLPSVY